MVRRYVYPWKRTNQVDVDVREASRWYRDIENRGVHMTVNLVFFWQDKQALVQTETSLDKDGQTNLDDKILLVPSIPGWETWWRERKSS